MQRKGCQMPNNRLEAVLQGIDDGGQLEQLVVDLLAREGYKVDPTGTRGPDGGRDGLLERGGNKGILHCSIQSIDEKIESDAEKAADRPESFDLFVFATTDNPAAVKRDRLERELGEKHGWQVKIYDLQRLRNQLFGNSENHDLIREHLHIDLSTVNENAQKDAEKFYETRIEELRSRDGYIGEIANRDTWPSTDGTKEKQNPPYLAIHLIPAEARASSKDRLAADFPDPPFVGRHHGQIEKFGSCIASTRRVESDPDSPYESYCCFDEDGWSEAVTTKIAISSEKPRLRSHFDQVAVEYIEDALIWYEKVDINLPLYVFLTLFHAEEYTMYVPDKVRGPYRTRTINSEVFKLGNATIESYNADIPQLLRKPFYRLWTQAGWETGSLNYSGEQDEDTGEKQYKWDPL